MTSLLANPPTQPLDTVTTEIEVVCLVCESSLIILDIADH